MTRRPGESTHTAHELAALAGQGMTLTDDEAAAVSAARKGQDMSDIVERLRACSPLTIALAHEAANTIEALRAQLQTALDSKRATTARYDARIAELEGEVNSLRVDTALAKAGLDEVYAENARLREALQPFAKYGAPSANNMYPDSYVPCNTHPFAGVSLTMGHFRRARKELKETKNV